MQIIYEPFGKAAEYAHLCANIYSGGCPHRCIFCYVPSVIQRTREQWLLEPCHPRKDVLKLIRKEVPKISGTNKMVHLCFTCDPYNPIDKEFEITRQVLAILKGHHIPFQILTKAGQLPQRDFDLYGDEDMFGVTLTCAMDDWCRKYEPGAAPTSERIKSLVKAREKGITTWVSLEPVLCAESALELIRMTHEFVCHYKIGPLNHCKVGCPADDYTALHWRTFGLQAVELLRKFNVGYYFKDDLTKYMTGVDYRQTDTRMLPREPLKAGKAGLFA